MRNEINQLTKELKEFFTPKTFLEIGSRDGHDTKEVADYWNLDPKNCFIIEAHPILFKRIKETYPQFNTYHLAASNVKGEVEFNAILPENGENPVGTSSILQPLVYHFSHEKVTVECDIMFNFLNSIYMDSPDLVKIDVEGFTYEVLQGFGDKLQRINAIQLETEKSEMWKDQKVHDDILKLMEENGFVLHTRYDAWDNQYDCLFLNQKFLS
jgi:FkbM family methyltransferase